MKTEDLKAQGLTDEQIKYVFAENGKDVEAAKKKAEEKLAADRDKWKARAETAEETLRGFDGVNVEQLKTDIASWKKKAEEAEAEYTKKIEERDFSDALKAEIENIKFSSEAAKKAVMADIQAAGLKLKDGKILGLSDLIDQYRKTDASAFVDEDEERAKEGAARFTTPRGNEHGKPMTKEGIFKIKDASERQAAIAQNIGLFRGE